MSLREMFAGLTAAAVFFWCAAQAGVENGVFWMVAGVAAAMSAVWWIFARQPRVRALAALVPLPFFFLCGMPLMSATLLWHSLALFVSGLAIAVLRPMNGRTALAVAVASYLAVFVESGLRARQKVAELEAARIRFPVESLATRLSYEASPPQGIPSMRTLRLNANVESSLQASEQIVQDFGQRGYGNRSWELQSLHERTYEHFIRAAGFGVGRMILPSPRRIERPALENIAFDSSPHESNLDYYLRWRDYGNGGANSTPSEVHDTSREDFLHPDGFGWIATPRVRVAGFIPHAFHQAVKQDGSDRCTVERLELVSLLKFDSPRVYVLDHLPRMDQLSGNDVPTRELDEFELRALQKLRTQEDVVIESYEDTTKMLGSLRAGQQCLECHSVQRGELLGAFSYVLREGARGEEREASDDGDALAAE
jgi:hypothetical protein